MLKGKSVAKKFASDDRVPFRPLPVMGLLAAAFFASMTGGYIGQQMALKKQNVVTAIPANLATAASTIEKSDSSLVQQPDPVDTASIAPAPSQATARPLSVEEAIALQNLLLSHNLDPGTVDGQFGSKTASAISEFIKMSGMPEDSSPRDVLQRLSQP